MVLVVYDSLVGRVNQNWQRSDLTNLSNIAYDPSSDTKSSYDGSVSVGIPHLFRSAPASITLTPNET